MSRILTHRDSRLLFGALTANGSFSLISGLALLSAARPLAELIGLPDHRWLLFIGVGLLIFAARLLWLGRTKRVRRADALVISAMDLAWVIGTVLLVIFLPALFTPAGTEIVLSVALVVLTLAEVQAYALWRTRDMG